MTKLLPDAASLRCFIVLAEELHFGRAAERLHMTQPTLSQKIRRLEGDLGAPLFTRSTRTVALSPSGEEFLQPSREALSKIEQAVLLARLAGGGIAPGGERLCVGSIEPAAYRLLPPIISRFRRRFPQTALDLKITDSSELLRALERGEIDVGLMRPPVTTNHISFRPLVSNRFVAVIPAQLSLAHHRVLTLADFVDEGVFTLDRFELAHFRQVHDQIRAAGIKPDTTVRVGDTNAALAAASAGLGITFLPDWVVGIADSTVVTRVVEDLVQTIPLGVAWRADNPVPGIAPFVEYAEIICLAQSEGGAAGVPEHRRSRHS